MTKRGHPDYGQGAATNFISGVADLGELASRLGSCDVYERSGNVIFLTDFTYGLSEVLAQTNGLGAGVTVDSTRAFKNENSILLTAGSDAYRTAGIIKRVKPVSLTKMAVEMTWSFGADNELVSIQMQHNTGSHKWVYRLDFDPVNDEILYRDGSTTNAKITDYAFGGYDADLWHTAKLVVDLENNEFVRLYLNDENFDVSPYTPFNGADATAKRFEAYLRNQSTAGNNAISNVDCLIVTINEP